MGLSPKGQPKPELPSSGRSSGTQMAMAAAGVPLAEGDICPLSPTMELLTSLLTICQQRLEQLHIRPPSPTWALRMWWWGLPPVPAPSQGCSTTAPPSSSLPHLPHAFPPPWKADPTEAGLFPGNVQDKQMEFPKEQGRLLPKTAWGVRGVIVLTITNVRPPCGLWIWALLLNHIAGLGHALLTGTQHPCRHLIKRLVRQLPATRVTHPADALLVALTFFLLFPTVAV